MSAEALDGTMHADLPGPRFRQRLNARGSIVYESLCSRTVSVWERTRSAELVTCPECLDELNGSCVDCADDTPREPENRARRTPAPRRRPGAQVTVLWGPKARSWAEVLPGSADLVIDLGRIVAAVVSPSATTTPDHVRHVALGMYRAGFARASKLHEDVGVWFVHPDATAGQLRDYRDRGFTLRPPR